MFSKIKRFSTLEMEYKEEFYLQVKITNAVCDNTNLKLYIQSFKTRAMGTNLWNKYKQAYYNPKFQGHFVTIRNKLL